MFSCILIDVAGAILFWPPEHAVDMQTNEVVLLIAYFIEFDFCFAYFFNVITENQATPSFQMFHL